MKCTEFEKLVYSYPELEENQKEDIKIHYKSCEHCKLLFHDMNLFFAQIEEVRKGTPEHSQPELLTDKITGKISSISVVSRNTERKVLFYVPNAIRYSLAAVSCGILFLFFIELVAPQTDFKVNEPSLAGTVINSNELRRSFKARKPRKSIFNNCKNHLTNKIDQACLKEKLDKLNL